MFKVRKLGPARGFKSDYSKGVQIRYAPALTKDSYAMVPWWHTSTLLEILTDGLRIYFMVEHCKSQEKSKLTQPPASFFLNKITTFDWCLSDLLSWKLAYRKHKEQKSTAVGLR